MEGRIKNLNLSSSATIKCILKPRSTVINQDTYREATIFLVNEDKPLSDNLTLILGNNQQLFGFQGTLITSRTSDYQMGTRYLRVK